jgi:Cu+-exporting ATPase
MAASSLSVVAKANRLRGFRPAHFPNDVHVPATDPVAEVGRDHKKEYDMSENSQTVTDPVCGMTIDPAAAASSMEDEGCHVLLLLPALRPELRRRPGQIYYASGS